MQDMKEIEEMMRRAKAVCKHREIGECIHLEPATLDDWLATHPGA